MSVLAFLFLAAGCVGALTLGSILMVVLTIECFSQE